MKSTAHAKFRLIFCEKKAGDQCNIFFEKMNSRQVSALLMRDVRARRVFRGVYAHDVLPRYVPGASAYIINTDDSRGRGLHWVAVYFDGRGNAEYFDSFGFPPLLQTVVGFLRRNTPGRLLYNDRHLQNFASSACGLYVVYYILRKSRGASLSSVQGAFPSNNNNSVNDRRVRALILSL